MAQDRNLLPIIECGSAQTGLAPGEAGRLDNVDRDPETRAEPQDRAHIGRYVGLVECDFRHGRWTPSLRHLMARLSPGSMPETRTGSALWAASFLGSKAGNPSP